MGVFISSITSVLLIFLPAVLYDSEDGTNLELQAIGVVSWFFIGFIQITQNLSRIYNGKTIRAIGV